MINNKVELIGSYGSDEIIACSAWTSTSRELTEDKIKRIPKLINMLWTQGHETPFEKATIHFLVNTDIATHIHLLKHRMSSMNGESARYKELNDKYYIPSDWRPNESGKPNHYVLNNWANILEKKTIEMNDLYHECLNQITPIVGRARAKESARFFKPYNTQIEADISFNMRSFANFLRLRKSEHAQLEVREVAQKMFDIVKALPQFEHTINIIEKHTLE